VEARIANLRLDGRIAAGFYTSRENNRNPNVGIRRPTQRSPVPASCKLLVEFLRTTKVLYVGISDVPGWWIAQANTLADLRGWSRFIGLQIPYNLIERTVERELIPMAKALDIGVTAWSPLSNGVLTGKYHGHGGSELGRMNSETMKTFVPEQQRAARIVAAVKIVSEQTGCSMAQVALAWLRYRPVPVIPIIGARKLTQLQDNLASFDLELSAEHLKSLEEASRVELGFSGPLCHKGGRCNQVWRDAGSHSC